MIRDIVLGPPTEPTEKALWLKAVSQKCTITMLLQVLLCAFYDQINISKQYYAYVGELPLHTTFNNNNFN